VLNQHNTTQPAIACLCVCACLVQHVRTRPNLGPSSIKNLKILESCHLKFRRHMLPRKTCISFKTRPKHTNFDRLLKIKCMHLICKNYILQILIFRLCQTMLLDAYTKINKKNGMLLLGNFPGGPRTLTKTQATCLLAVYRSGMIVMCPYRYHVLRCTPICVFSSYNYALNINCSA